MDCFFSTDEESWLLLGQRIVVALVMFPHGAQKLLGWFGGYGFQGTMQFFTGTVGLPAPLAFLVIVGESIGALLLAVGALTRAWAVVLSATMLGAIVTTHATHGFFMNWFGQQKGEGFEFHLLMLALTLPLALAGGGRFAADSYLARRLVSPGVLPASARADSV